jgi:RNase P/RNase MRP subunit p30
MKPVLVYSNSFDKARKEIAKNKGEEIIFLSPNDDLNRKILEKEKINILLLSQSEREDKSKQRNSGLNQVLTKIAKKNKVQIGILLDEIINSSSKNKAKILARVKQNIELCSKDKIQMKFIFVDKKYERDIYDLKALGLILGMPTWMVKNL